METIASIAEIANTMKTMISKTQSISATSMEIAQNMAFITIRLVNMSNSIYNVTDRARMRYKIFEETGTDLPP